MGKHASPGGLGETREARGPLMGTIPEVSPLVPRFVSHRLERYGGVHITFKQCIDAGMRVRGAFLDMGEVFPLRAVQLCHWRGVSYPPARYFAAGQEG